MQRIREAEWGISNAASNARREEVGEGEEGSESGEGGTDGEEEEEEEEDGLYASLSRRSTPASRPHSSVSK